MHGVLNAVDRLSRLAGFVAVLLVLIITEIICRTLFNLSLSFAWAYRSSFLGCAMFLGAAFTLRTGGHVRAAFLPTSRIPGVARTVEFPATIFGVGVTTCLAWATGSFSPTTDEALLVCPTSGIATGAVLLALQMLVRLIRLVIGDEPDDREAMQSYSVE